jgi:CRP/FNR family transcriptional regulator
MKTIKEYLHDYPAAFAAEAAAYGQIMDFEKDTEIVKMGQYIKFIPLVLEGIIKVFTRFEDKELLLYYIESGESCIMSFNAGIKNTPSKIIAIAEEKALLLLLPAEKVGQWIKIFPAVNQLFYNLYNQRYASLLDTINHLLFHRLDQRLYTYLLEMSRQKNSMILHITHRQIAGELGTVREVISRVMKKLELENKIKQLPHGIEILATGNQSHKNR